MKLMNSYGMTSESFDSETVTIASPQLSEEEIMDSLDNLNGPSKYIYLQFSQFEIEPHSI